jgi:hypothetical protein
LSIEEAPFLDAGRPHRNNRDCFRAKQREDYCDRAVFQSAERLQAVALCGSDDCTQEKFFGQIREIKAVLVDIRLPLMFVQMISIISVYTKIIADSIGKVAHRLRPLLR